MRAFGQIIIVLFFLSTETSYANQSRDTLLQNIIFLEAGGAAGYGSLNYERFFFKHINPQFQYVWGLAHTV